MTKTSVATNLLGRRVRVTLGMNELTQVQLEERRSPDNRAAVWRLLGYIGEVLAVYQSENVLMLAVSMFHDGAIVELCASHCRLVEQE